MGFIYSIKNTVNGREYIGQTRAKKVETRWNQHKTNPHGILKYAFPKWGLENFIFSIVSEIPVEELNDREVKEIKDRNTMAPYGYNLRSGGEAGSCSPYTRMLLSKLAILRFAGKLKKFPTKEQQKRHRITYYRKHGEYVRFRQRLYNAKNREIIRGRDRNRRMNRTPEQKMKIAEQMKAWRLNNPRPPRVLSLEQKKRYREAAKEAIARGEAKRKDKRKNRTPEEVERDNKVRAEKRTPEREEARRQRRRELEANRTAEEKAERLLKRKENETDEQKERRRALARERWANRTPEQIEKEQERSRKRYEESKNKKLEESRNNVQGSSTGDTL